MHPRLVEGLGRWNLATDGPPISTPGSALQPVIHRGRPAMLKLALHPEERAGNAWMVWSEGRGTAPVLAHDGDLILMPRGERALVEVTRDGEDREATAILCAVVARLHEGGRAAPPSAVPLTRWFGHLEPLAARHGGFLPVAAETAAALLADQREVVPLHGDIHHGNVLHFRGEGWLAIDPKGLVGDRCFDYANLFCNPDADSARANFARRVDDVAGRAGLERERLLRWILAWAGLSAAWSLEGIGSTERARTAGEAAAAQLGLAIS